VVGHNDVERLTQKKTGVILQAATGFQGGNFLKKNLRIENNPVTDYAPFTRVQDTGRNQVEYHFFISDNKGMTCIVSALKTDYIVSIFGKDINYLTFSLIAPLGSNHNNIRHS